jgi:hypothetical protein
MRLKRLEDGYRPLQKFFLRVIRTRIPDGEVPGPMAVLSYRRELFGKHLAKCYQEGMRGATEWTTGEIELFAAFVSQLNKCKY